jgi:L-fucose isomerase-like protein
MSLRIGFAAVIRPLFKGDSPGASTRALAGLREVGHELGFEVLTPAATNGPVHAETGKPLPAFAIHDQASAEQAARELAVLDLDLLIVQHTTFATGEVLAPLLRSPLPLALWALPEVAGGRGEGGPLPLNSLCGLNMTLSFADMPPVGRERPVKWLYGEAHSAWFRRRLAPTLTAVRALRALSGASVLQIGGTAPHFYGLEEEPVLAGVRVERLELAELFELVERVPASAAKELAARWGEVELTAVDNRQLERSAALELALGELVAAGGHRAVALRCWPELPDSCGTMACATLARLGDGGVAAACEGDVMGALSMLALQGASGDGALLLDLSDVDEERGALFWHCGNGPLSWAGRSGTRLATHFNRDGLGTVRDMTIRRGPATGFRLLAGGRRALIFSGEFAGESAGSGFDGVRGWLGDLSWNGTALTPSQFLANLLDRRLPHHFAFGSGELSEGMQELCGWLGSEPLPAAPERNTL